MKKLIKFLLGISILSNIILVGYFIINISINEKVNYKKKYIELKLSYIELAKAQKYNYEIILELTTRDPEFKKYFKEYDDLSVERWRDAIRRKAIVLELEIERLEKE